jgi:hypothetical protein
MSVEVLLSSEHVDVGNSAINNHMRGEEYSYELSR